MKNTNVQIQVQQIPRSINKKKFTPTDIKLKLVNDEEFLKATETKGRLLQRNN